MLQGIRIESFQGIASAEIPLGDVTVIRGRNGHGKTSVVEAIAFALLGEALRGGTISDVIRYGRAVAEVDVILADGTKLGRKVTAKTSSRSIGLGTVKADIFAGEVRRLVGDPRAIRCVLLSGGLLSMKPDELQRFLVDLNPRAAIDATAIGYELGGEVIEIAKKHKLTLPTSLGAEWKKAREIVEGVRLARFQDLDRAKAAVQLAPAPALEEERKVVSIEKAIASLQSQREAAVKAEAASSAAAQATREEQIRSLVESIARAEQLLAETQAKIDAAGVTRKVATIEKELSARRSEAARAEGLVADLDKQIARRATTEAPRPGDEELVAKLGELQQASADRQRELNALLEEHRRAVAAVDGADVAAARLPAGGECASACEHCVVTNANKLREQAAKERASLAAKSDSLSVRVNIAREAVKEADDRAIEARDAATRVDVMHAKDKDTGARLDATGVAIEARRIEKILVAEIEQAKAAAALRGEHVARTELLERDRKALAELRAAPTPEAPTTKVADLDARIARERDAVTAARARDHLATLVQAQEEAHATWKELDLVAKALGSGGAMTTLVAKCAEPFLLAANEALQLLAPEWTVSIDADRFGWVVQQPGGIVTPDQLSRGSRWRLRAALQRATAKIACVPFLALDEIEDLDDLGLEGLSRVIESCVSDAVQVLVLQHGVAQLSADYPVVQLENGTTEA